MHAGLRVHGLAISGNRNWNLDAGICKSGPAAAGDGAPHCMGLSMPPDISRVVAKIHEAGLAHEAWPEALKSLTDALGVAGAAYIVSNKRTKRVDWACFSGLSAEFQPAYINYYAPLDPFTPLLNSGRNWMKLSESISEPLLRRSEWYNDFVLGCGVRDILGVRLVDTPSHFAIFGLHQQIRRGFGDRTGSIMDDVAGPLVSATLRHIENFFGPAPDDTGAENVAEGTRYYFHVSNGKQYLDETGSVFSALKDAIAHARVLAAELALDGDWDGFVISVTNADGRVAAQIPVRP